jgi:hypothetical protein
MESTNEERIALLEKKVKRLQYINYIKFGIVVLGFIGVTTILMNEIKKIKLK